MQKDMAEEIVLFLTKKFCDDVENNKKSSSKIVIYSQYPLSDQSLYNHFDEIKKSLGEILGRSRPPAEDIEKIREKLYCLNDLWTELKVVPNSHLRTRINLRKKSTSIKEELINIFKRDSGKALSRTASKQADGEAISSTQPSAVSNVDGFHDDVTSLEKVLVRPGSEDRFKAIGIMGKTGIGKTALCQFLFNKREVIKDYFLPRIWISMSTLPVDEQDQKVAIVERMLESLGVEKEIISKGRHDFKGLLYALHLQLQGKRYLIVLDDASSNKDNWYQQLNSSPTRVGKWDRLACGLPKGCGGAVIVTSRNEELAEKMVGGEGFLHRVLPLSDPESSWSIFIRAAERQCNKTFDEQAELPINLEILKKEILQKCAGLPLTATMMGEYEKFLY